MFRMHSCRKCPASYLTCSKLQRHVLKRHSAKPPMFKLTNQKVSCIVCRHQSESPVEAQMHLIQSHFRGRLETRPSFRSLSVEMSHSLANNGQSVKCAEATTTDEKDEEIEDELENIDPDIAFNDEDDTLELQLTFDGDFEADDDDHDAWKPEENDDIGTNIFDEDDEPKAALPPKKKRPGRPRIHHLESSKGPIKPRFQSVVCSICNSEVRKYYLKLHMAKVHGKDKRKRNILEDHSNQVDDDLNPKNVKKGPRKTKPGPRPAKKPKSKRKECPECHKDFERGYLKTHINAIHAQEKIFLCSKCSDAFTTRQALNNHLRHHEAPQFLCPKCPKTFPVEQSLNNHITVFHSEEEQKRFQCLQCPKKFALSTRLKKHVDVVHKRIKQLRCWLCSHYIYDLKELAEHVKEKHEGAVRFQCSECPLGFLAKNRYDSHVKVVHRQIKEFKCYYCPLEFGWTSCRFKHMASAHGHTKDTPKPL